MAIHFTGEELAQRRTRTTEALAAAGLDGLLMFRQESMYYLTGYDTFGYVFFQCLYLGTDGTLTLLTRPPDLRQAQHTSVIEDIRLWVDVPGVSPADRLREILDEHGCRGKRLGVEWEAYGLTARNGQRLTAALDGFCELAEASELVSRLRAIKSPAEMAYVREAAKLGDEALDIANRSSVPGAFEGDILADMQGAIFRGGGDWSGNEWIIGSGHDALLCRTKTGRRHLEASDQFTLEFAGAYRHYHAALMRTILTGKPPQAQVDMHKAAVESLHAAADALRPGRPVGEVFDAHARVLDAHGHEKNRLAACGYGMGTTFAPNWMDWPMFFHGNPVEAQPGMVFFIHIAIFDSDNGLAMTTGQSYEVTDKDAKTLSQASLELVVN
ncbi:MAG: Xaa-Pro peptidase family protein [Alphaproteobacteria bacterium]|nr:Xaa-Pro peptidase family protein [Alphaproteobacteria bacterium]